MLIGGSFSGSGPAYLDGGRPLYRKGLMKVFLSGAAQSSNSTLRTAPLSALVVSRA